MMMGAVSALVMTLPRIRRSKPGHEHYRNNRNQRQLEDVFHFKSPNS
jgi:hypothetical protein